MSTFIISAQLSAKHRSKTEILDANNVSTFGNQKDNHHPPKQQTFDEHPINAPAFETEYQDFAPLKLTIESVFFEVWYIYTKEVTDNLITQRLQK